MTTTDTRCLTCGHKEAWECPTCELLVHRESRECNNDHHPFVPAPITTDAVSEAWTEYRRVVEANGLPLWSTQRVEAERRIEAAIVTRERERFEAFLAAAREVGIYPTIEQLRLHEFLEQPSGATLHQQGGQ